jgi:hypothetical protein
VVADLWLVLDMALHLSKIIDLYPAKMTYDLSQGLGAITGRSA